MSLSTYYLKYGRHLAPLRRRRRRRRGCAYSPRSNTASHDNHEKINLWVSFSFAYEYGAPLGGPSGRRSSANNFTSSLFVLKKSPFYVAESKNNVPKSCWIRCKLCVAESIWRGINLDSRRYRQKVSPFR